MKFTVSNPPEQGQRECKFRVECAVPPPLNFGHDTSLGLAVPSREETRIQYQNAKTQIDGFQPAKIDWLNRVGDEMNKLMYKTPLDWKQTENLVEVADMLVDLSVQVLASRGKWFSLHQYGVEWNMQAFTKKKKNGTCKRWK